MALTWRQLRLYVHRVTVWRATEPVDATTGKPGATTWAVTSTAVPCYLELRQSLHAPADFLLAESENMDTTDLCHMEYTVSVDSGDVLKVTTGPETGSFYRVRGNPKIKSLFANKLSIQVTRMEAAPSGVS